MPDAWSINERTWSDHKPLRVTRGQPVVVEMTDRTVMAHPMHLHGHHFQVVTLDGTQLDDPTHETVLKPANGTVAIAFDADNPGRWLLQARSPNNRKTRRPLMSLSAHTTLAAIILAASLTGAQAQTVQNHAAHHVGGQPDDQAQMMPAPRTPPVTGMVRPGQGGGMPGLGAMGPGGQPGGRPAMMGGDMGRMMQMMNEMAGTTRPAAEPDDAMRMGQLMHSMSQMMATMGGMIEQRGAGELVEASPAPSIERRIAFLKTQLGITDAQQPRWTAFADALREGPQNVRAAYAEALKDGPPATAPGRAELRVKLLSATLDALKTAASAERSLYAVLTANQRQVANQLLSSPIGRP